MVTNLTLIPAQNTYVSSGKADKNFSSSNVLYAGSSASNFLYRTLLYFDMHLVPHNVEIESAILNMYAEYINTRNSSGFFTPYILTSSWDVEQVTWNSLPAFNSSIAGKTVEISTYGWQGWDITNIVKLWSANQSENYGLLLTSTEDIKNDIKKFHSLKSYYYRQYRPFLEIKYDFKSNFTLSSRGIVDVCEQRKTDNEYLFSEWQNTSIYSTYTFFVQNMGSHPATIFVQISPDRRAVVNEPFMICVAPGAVEALVPQKFGFFTRLAYRSSFHGRSTSLKIWFQAQV